VTPKNMNMAASVHARLAERARRTDRPFQEILQYHAMERFLYRLCRSPYAERFVLKGALMLRVWDAPTARPTKDVDLLGRMANSLDNLSNIVREICVVEVEPDGLVFKEATVKAGRIKPDADYQGVRVRFDGRQRQLERSRRPGQRAGLRAVALSTARVAPLVQLDAEHHRELLVHGLLDGCAHLTEPKDHGREIRAYIRDPDGHLIEVGQTTGALR
jgi:catechol 2,3-dioxygenase-like lactoylglutathione lyase family enzyme